MENKINLLVEFEKRYNGIPNRTMDICEEIAKEFGLDPEFVADYVYLHRYEDEEGE
jgi:N-acetylglucosamine kinase-like BadF-type ATPase